MEKKSKSFQSCLTLCNHVNRSLLASSVHGDSPGKNTKVGCHFLLQGIFPTQELNPCLRHWQALNQLGSPVIPLEVIFRFCPCPLIARSLTQRECIW